jgi:hypothetical protein
MSITLTTNYSFKMQDLGHPERDTFTAANLKMIDAAILAGVSPLTAAKIIVGSAENLAVGVVMSGDISIGNTGVTAIGADKVLNTMLANITRGSIKVGGVADAPTDLDAKGDAKILIGDATDIASVAVTGDVTIDNAGLTAIGADKVTKTQIDADIAGAGLVQAVGGELDVNADDSTLEVDTDVLRIKALGVTIAKLEAALLKDIVTVPLSFQTGEETVTKIYFPYKVTINKIRSIVMLVIAGTDDGSITGGNIGGASNLGVVTVAASSALDTEDDASPDSNNVVAEGGYYQLATAKATDGGKVLVTLEYTRTA